MPDISDGTLNMDELERLLTAAAFKDDAANWEHIVIRRKGQKLLEFSIRPLMNWSWLSSDANARAMCPTLPVASTQELRAK